MNTTFIGSPNYEKGRGGKPIQYIVVHHMAGTLAAADAVFQDTQRRTSAHYGIGRSGEIHQYVLESDTAFHAGGKYDNNQRSIGIEHEDLNADNYTDVEYQISATLIREICNRYNLPINANTIRPHRAFTATACPGSLDISRLISLAQQGEDMATKEQLIELYKLALPNRPVDYDWVEAWTDKDMSDALQALRDDPSRQAYIKGLVDDAAAYNDKPGKLKVLEPGDYRVK